MNHSLIALIHLLDGRGRDVVRVQMGIFLRDNNARVIIKRLYIKRNSDRRNVENMSNRIKPNTYMIIAVFFLNGEKMEQFNQYCLINRFVRHANNTYRVTKNVT